MFWADKIVDQIEKDWRDTIASGKELIVRDEKTASGHPHVGSLVGVGVHDVVNRVLKERGIKSRYYFEINDTDPMDGLPSYLDALKYQEHMGKQLRSVPAPEEGYENIAEYFAKGFIEAMKRSGFHPELYRTSELYDSGRMNDVIQTALEKADAIRKIYKEVSKSEKEKDWLPLNVVCESCGKIGTTKVTSFDGKQVEYVCEINAVTWANGCDHKGLISPFDGNATLPWKVEWAAKFKVMNVDVEGAGKDHLTKGGAHDAASRISEEVFKYKTPFSFPYEFFLTGGKKMSSSGGNAATAEEVSKILPSHVLQLAFIGRNINRQTNFNPEGDSIPLLFDRYDQLAKEYWNKSVNDDTRIFSLIHPDNPRLLEKRFLPRFTQIAFLIQMPHMDIEEEVAKIKEAPLTNEDKEELSMRSKYAKMWLETYADEQFIFTLQDTIPDSAAELTDKQKVALRLFAEKIESTDDYNGQAIHECAHEIRETSGLSPSEFFSGVYLIFLGKSHGPKVGWFLSVLKKDFVINRLLLKS